MTKTKAIEVLNIGYSGCVRFRETVRGNSDEFDYLNDLMIALLTAIDVLKQSSSVEADPMGEYISKQSVIDYLNGYLHSIGEDGTYNPLFDRGQRRALINSIQDISAIKAADVQPVKHGRWIFQNRHDEDGRCIYHCSKCNLETKVFPCNLIPWQMHEKYCAGCGARMDGDSE